ncbi:MAG: 3TM-type holin [Thermodesulfobacteriota bacterium]|nr:3TM-type holin [Thermodesulfobacteriota bacterium]
MNILGNLGAGGIGSIINGVGRMADDLITTDKERLEMALREKELDTQILSKVHETNIAEAQHRTLFVAGWRPFIGWLSGLALCYTFL